MTNIIIRYQTKPEATALNPKLVEDVFRELNAAAPDGVAYAVLRTDDNTFFHIVQYENEETNARLTGLPSFKAFAEDGESRRAAPFERNAVTVIGNYRILPK
jgi:hypothetical protein